MWSGTALLPLGPQVATGLSLCPPGPLPQWTQRLPCSNPWENTGKHPFSLQLLKNLSQSFLGFLAKIICKKIFPTEALGAPEATLQLLTQGACCLSLFVRTSLGWFSGQSWPCPEHLLEHSAPQRTYWAPGPAWKAVPRNSGSRVSAVLGNWPNLLTEAKRL